MSVVKLTNNNKKEYDMYRYLREFANDANIDSLKQISVYIAISTDDKFNINTDCELKLMNSSKEDEHYVLSINDGRQIMFSNNSLHFGFILLNYDIENKVFMLSEVSLKNMEDLSTLSVYSEITTKDFGKYVITFRPNDMSDNTLKFGTINYYTNDEVDWVHEISGLDNIERNFDIVAKNNEIFPFTEKIYFDLPLELEDTELDCYDGCLKNYLNRVDLLYSNILVYMKTKKKQRKL